MEKNSDNPVVGTLDFGSNSTQGTIFFVLPTNLPSGFQKRPKFR